METGIEKAVRIAGSQTALAQLLGLTPQAVQKWVGRGKPPVERCKDIETALHGQVTRVELDPDQFGDMQTEAKQPA